MPEKVCKICNIEKDISEYSKDSSMKFGCTSICKSCRKIKDKKYRDENKEKLSVMRKAEYQRNIENKKAYRLKTKDKMKEYWREYNLKNRESKREYHKKWVQENKEHVKEYADKYKPIKNILRKDYYEKDKPKRNEYLRNKRINDLEFKLKTSLRNSFRNKLKNKTDSFFNYTGISYESYINYFKEKFPEEMKTFTEKNKYHIDHIIPCSAYDFSDVEEIKKCWMPENLRIISAEENLKKSYIIDFDLIKKHNIEHLIPKK
jgi:hypothetical protein